MKSAPGTAHLLLLALGFAACMAGDRPLYPPEGPNTLLDPMNDAGGPADLIGVT